MEHAESHTVLLGIACFYHDSSAALLVDGKVIAAAQEERFSRRKHDSGFPRESIAFCLSQAGLTAADIDYVAFYEKPLVKFERLLRTYIATWPRGLVSFIKAMLSWSGSKFWIEQAIRREVGYDGPLLWVEHHYAHAASSYYTAPCRSAALLVADGVGEWDTVTIGRAVGNKIELTHSIPFPHSLGLLYSTLTYYLGFAVNSDEYKVMGLAPYGNPATYEKAFQKLISSKDDGSFELHREYFAYEYGTRMSSAKLDELFGGPPRTPESELTERHKDIAAALQQVTERVLLAMAAHVAKITQEKELCMTGGVALNSAANGKIVAARSFDRVHVPSAPGDAGGSLGAALYAYHDMLGFPKAVEVDTSPYLGPAYTNEDIQCSLAAVAAGRGFSYTELRDDELYERIAMLIDENSVVGWFSGRMEFGPRALGDRSILADPRKKENWQRINLKIKFRESFRPLAPSVLAEHAQEYFDLDQESPYMMFVAPVLVDTIPAVTHVDGTARVHTVRREVNPRYHALLEAFYRRTGCPVLVNTSFNVRGEPIVRTPEDALRCFFTTDMDHLVLGNWLVSKDANADGRLRRS